MEAPIESISLPFCTSLPHTLDVPSVLLALADLPYLSVLESSRRMQSSGRYSFVAADPFGSIRHQGGTLFWNDEPISQDPWQFFKKQLAAWQIPVDKHGIPFRGGAMGYVGYEMNHHLEKLPPITTDDWSLPDMWIHFYDVVIVFDHYLHTCSLFSSGFPEEDASNRKKKAIDRGHYFMDLLKKQPCEEILNGSVPGDAWHSNFTEQSYREAVGMVRDYIEAGDIFQANISQRFTTVLPDNFNARSFYLQLRTMNPAPFSAFLSYDSFSVASASPERFIQLRSGQAETRPIKGTRPRSKDLEEDDVLATELLASVKDRAENIMIVDLLRNDFSKVCVPGSVLTPVLCSLESFVNVHHLVSIIQGRLKEDKTSVDLFAACFPGGSITGAPKKRAMEIIQEIEQLPRHVYCGAIGYWGFDGDMDTNIAIRTVLFKDNKACFQVGGGITWPSDPLTEYKESLIKAEQLFKTFSP